MTETDTRYDEVTPLRKWTHGGHAPVVLENGHIVVQSETGNPVVIDPNNPSKRKPKFPVPAKGKLYPLVRRNISNVPLWVNYVDGLPGSYSHRVYFICFYDWETNTLTRIHDSLHVLGYAYGTYDVKTRKCTLWNTSMSSGSVYSLGGKNTPFKPIASFDMNENRLKPASACRKTGYMGSVVYEPDGTRRKFKEMFISLWRLSAYLYLVQLPNTSLVLWDTNKQLRVHRLIEVIRNKKKETKCVTMKMVLGFPDVQFKISEFLCGTFGTSQSFSKLMEDSKTVGTKRNQQAKRDRINARNREKNARLREIKAAKKQKDAVITTAQVTRCEIAQMRREIAQMQHDIAEKEAMLPSLDKQIEVDQFTIEQLEERYAADYPSRKRKKPKSEATESDTDDDFDFESSDTESDNEPPAKRSCIH